MATQNQLKISQALNGDGARSTKFDALLLMGTGHGTEETTFQSLVKTQSFPSVKNEPSFIKYKGISIPLKGITKYDNSWQCTFYLQEGHELKIFLEDWMHQASQDKHFNQEESPTTKKIRSEGIYRSITIKQRNFSDETTTVSYELLNVYPKNISTIEVDYSSVGQVLQLTVEFSYSHFIYSKVESKDLSSKLDKLIDGAKGSLNSQVKGLTSKIDTGQQDLIDKLKPQSKSKKVQGDKTPAPNAPEATDPNSDLQKMGDYTP